MAGLLSLQSRLIKNILLVGFIFWALLYFTLPTPSSTVSPRWQPNHLHVPDTLTDDEIQDIREVGDHPLPPNVGDQEPVNPPSRKTFRRVRKPVAVNIHGSNRTTERRPNIRDPSKKWISFRASEETMGGPEEHKHEHQQPQPKQPNMKGGMSSVASSSSSPPIALGGSAEELVVEHPGAKNAQRPGEMMSLPVGRRANAAIVVLCRNSDLMDIRSTVREFEDRFNRRYRYPYVFMNDVPFTEEFKDFVKHTTESPIEFVTVVEESWRYPPFINQTLADQNRCRMENEGIIYGGSLSYRHMCRFYSGFFFRHPALAKYEYYWRLEPGVHFYCDLKYDPFMYMEENGKKYGFVITLLEVRETIPSLWSTVRDWVRSFRTRRGGGLPDPALLRFLADDESGDYNGCHFWSNFEIARLDLWRDETYLNYFDFLDRRGGFFYERWGDAPVHSIYIGLTLRKDEVHFFEDIGYKHDDFLHCSEEGELGFSCLCPPNEISFDYQVGSCLRRWHEYEDELWTFGDPL